MRLPPAPSRAARLLGVWGLCAVSCAAGPRVPAQFRGHDREGIHAARVRAVSVLPIGYDAIGTVSAHCTLINGAQGFRGEWLSDLDCSAERLRLALRLRAARAGAELLVGERCGSLSVRSPERGTVRIRCSAEVAATARGGAPEPGPDHSAPADATDHEPSPDEVWNTRVDFTPDRRAAARAPKRSGLVAERSETPLDHVVLGDIVVRCGHGCSQRGAHAAVRIVAGRVGGSAAVGVRCIRNDDDWLCTGRATAYEHEPELVGWGP